MMKIKDKYSEIISGPASRGVDPKDHQMFVNFMNNIEKLTELETAIINAEKEYGEETPGTWLAKSVLSEYDKFLNQESSNNIDLMLSKCNDSLLILVTEINGFKKNVPINQRFIAAFKALLSAMYIMSVTIFSAIFIYSMAYLLIYQALPTLTVGWDLSGFFMSGYCFFSKVMNPTSLFYQAFQNVIDNYTIAATVQEIPFKTRKLQDVLTTVLNEIKLPSSEPSFKTNFFIPPKGSDEISGLMATSKSGLTDQINASSAAL